MRKEGQIVVLAHENGTKIKGSVLFERPDSIAITILDNGRGYSGGSMRVNKSKIKWIEDV